MQGSPRIDELRQKFHENPRRYFAPLANEYRKAGDPEQAIAICRAHLAQQPGHMSGHVVYAQSLYDAERIDEAHVVFEKALSLDPDNVIVLRHLGNISRQRGDAAEARHWYSRALDADPQDSEIAVYLAELTEPLTATEEPSEVAVEEKADEVTHVPQAVNEVAAAPESDEAVEADEPSEPAAASEPPFLTRTIAELYAKQGYHDEALGVYQQLAETSPEDSDIADRLRELSEPGVVSAPALPDVVESTVASEAESPSSEQLTSAADFSADDFAEASDEDAVPGFQAGDEEVAAEPPDSVERSVEPSVELPEAGALHFTDVELGDGDSWDTDQWGAGFSSLDEEVVPLGVFNNVHEDTADEDAAQSEPPHEDALVAVPAIAETESQNEDLVAYSPQLPDEAELAHYVPKGPTIREFFATLGAHRPPGNDDPKSFTARASVPDVDRFPLASEAFSSLFPDSPVSEEDSKAAFALSGALGGQPQASISGPSRSTPQNASARVAGENLPVPPTAGMTPRADQESEEDIRRFREWLDGLADS